MKIKWNRISDPASFRTVGVTVRRRKGTPTEVYFDLWFGYLLIKRSK